MIEEAINRSGKPPKAIAVEVGYSVDAIYAACKGTRPIPRKAVKRIAGIHPLMGLAIAQENTGYKWFEFIEGDRHPQVMLQRTAKEDREVDELLKDLGWRLIDKQGPEDLTEEDRFALIATAKEISDRIRADINLLIELDDRFHIGLIEYLTATEKEKDRVKAAV